jgi:hypothetical protein
LTLFVESLVVTLEAPGWSDPADLRSAFQWSLSSFRVHISHKQTPNKLDNAVQKHKSA